MSERDIWNRAIRAALSVCHDVDRAASGQGHALMRPRQGASLSVNPHAHRSAETRLGAARCFTGISELLK